MAAKKPSGKGKGRKKPAARAKRRSREQREADAKKVVERTREEAAKREDAPKTGTALEQVERNAEIFKAWARGLTPSSIAPIYEMTEERVREIIREYREAAARVTSLDPVVIVEEHLFRMEAMLDELAGISAREKGAVRVAAVLARLKTLHETRELLQGTGILPHDLGTLKLSLDGDRAARQILEVLKRHKVPEKVWEDIADTIDPPTVDITDAEVVEEAA